jgi:hypothetical protein
MRRILVGEFLTEDSLWLSPDQQPFYRRCMRWLSPVIKRFIQSDKAFSGTPIPLSVPNPCLMFIGFRSYVPVPSCLVTPI